MAFEALILDTFSPKELAVRHDGIVEFLLSTLGGVTVGTGGNGAGASMSSSSEAVAPGVLFPLETETPSLQGSFSLGVTLPSGAKTLFSDKDDALSGYIGSGVRFFGFVVEHVFFFFA